MHSKSNKIKSLKSQRWNIENFLKSFYIRTYRMCAVTNYPDFKSVAFYIED